MVQIIDGKAIAGEIRCEIAAEVACSRPPTTSKDSRTYVQMKCKACTEVSIRSFDVDLLENISEAALVAKVHRLNADPAVHGISSAIESKIYSSLLLVVLG
ncbi:5,10-methylene-tetrahydrofolate dehydrogenase/5,10-methenyl-tetrahydrofolate cyclohydrolase [Hordeum vulgare]|nr:5,10-methylene-tetrahydrofolate dehydrogenase/5,10-methenyl-tetrahydrofolate cyclohydrolase [Hordeum vulgare]